MAFKIKVSKPGFNVLTETDPNNLSFTSDYNTLKYYSNGTVSFSVNVGPGYYIKSGTISHNLGYKPFFKVYAYAVGYMPCGIFYLPSLDYSSYLGASVDNSKMYFTASGYVDPTGAGTASFTASFQYKIFKNNLGL